MSYDVSFKVKIQDMDKYVSVGNCNANITWNLRNMITESTGLKWENEANNGLVKTVIPHIQSGLKQLLSYPSKYKQYEAENGWGTLEGCIMFFRNIIRAWEDFALDDFTKDLVDVATFWIE